MDDDDLRRGRPTTHIAFDEATAILAADAMQPLAFRILATDPSMACEPAVRLKIIDLLAESCGSTGMTGGQSIDLEAEGRRLNAALHIRGLHQKRNLVFMQRTGPRQSPRHTNPGFHL